MADNTNNSSSSSSSNTNSNASSSSSSGRSRGRSNNTSNNNSNNNSNNIRIDIKQGFPESYPKINISAKMFVDRMDSYFQLQEVLGNTVFTDNAVKVLTFLNNVTDSPGTAIQLYYSSLRQQSIVPPTYATICAEFIKTNTDVAEQDNLMRELIYELRPDTNTYKHEDAVRDYVNRFNEKLRRLEGSYDHQSMKNAIMQHIHPALCNTAVRWHVLLNTV